MAPERILNVERIVVPIGLVVSMIATSIWITSYLGGRMTAIEHRMELIGRDLREAAAHAEMALLRREFAGWVQTQQAKGIALTDLPPR